MKKVKLVLIALLLGTLSYAQTAADFFNQSSGYTVAWKGVDYTHVKILGDFGGRSAEQVKNEFFESWNYVVLEESEKYNWAEALRTPNLKNDVGMIMEKNKEAVTDDMVVYSAPEYSEEDIQGFVKEYTPTEEGEIGVVLIAEAYNKLKPEGQYAFVVYNTKTLEVLMQQKVTGKPGGFGLRNYWAATIYNVLEKVEKNYYKKWKSSYK
tara:strand:+ start:1745 stop:2371 length:627 start_codon:yes stop_codon:yes gene_type:complete